LSNDLSVKQWQASIQIRVGLTQNFKGGNDPPLQKEQRSIENVVDSTNKFI
jgi:hypothetical protein